MARTWMTIAEWARFIERYGLAPYSIRGAEEDPPDPEKPKPITFESQEKLDALIQKEKARAAKAAKDDPDFLKEIAAQVKADLLAEQKASKQKAEGEYEKLLDDAFAMKTGVIPDDSPLGQAMRRLHATNKDYEATFEAILESRLEELPEEMRELMPEDVPPSKQVEWLEKALKVKAKTGDPKKPGDDGAKPPKKTNGHKDPPPKGDQSVKVDDVIKEMQETGIYRKR